MSYATPAPPPQERPATVTIANWLLILVAALYALSFVLVISQVGTVNEIYREVFAGTEVEGTEGILTATTVVASALFLLFAAGLVVLAILNNKGKNATRIVTWVLGGIALCCGGLGLLASGLNMQTGDNFDQAELERLMAERLPGWYEPLSIATGIIEMLALIVALILLALPASNEFFRKPEQPFEPPPSYPSAG